MRVESLKDLLTQFPDIDGYWDVNRLLTTESQIRLLPGGEALTQLARVQGLQENILEARVTLDQVKTVLDETTGPEKTRLEIRFLLELGRLLCLSMTPAKAQAHFFRAFEMATKIPEFHYFAVDAAVMLSITQPPKYQNEWLIKATNLAEESRNAQANLWKSQLYVMQGWHLFDFRRLPEALASFEKAAAQVPPPSDDKMLVIKWSIARIMRGLNRFEEALTIQRYLKTQLTIGAAAGHVDLEIAENLQNLQQHQEAKTYFESAYAELSMNRWYSDNRAEELSRMQYIHKKRT